MPSDLAPFDYRYEILPATEEPVTSDNAPLEVDYLPDIGLKGTLGMTLLPGRTSRGFASVPLYRRDVKADLARLRHTFYTNTLITLIEPHEFEAHGASDLFPLAARMGMETLWFPIRDHFVPHSVEAFDGVVQDIIKRVGRGENVVTHCKAGKGRTGLTAGCVLVALGWKPEEAVKVVQASRDDTIKNPVQQDYLRYYLRYLNGDQGPDPYKLSAMPSNSLYSRGQW